MAAEAAASGRPPLTMARHIWPAMANAVAHVFRAAGKRLNPRGIDYCFELLVRPARVRAAGQRRMRACAGGGVMMSGRLLNAPRGVAPRLYPAAARDSTSW